MSSPMLAEATSDIFSYVERVGSLGILAWIVIWASQRLILRLDANTAAVTQLAESIKIATTQQTEAMREHFHESRRVLSDLERTVSTLKDRIDNHLSNAPRN